MAGTFVDVPTNSQHSGTGISNLLIMDSDSLTQRAGPRSAIGRAPDS